MKRISSRAAIGFVVAAGFVLSTHVPVEGFIDPCTSYVGVVPTNPNAQAPYFNLACPGRDGQRLDRSGDPTAPGFVLSIIVLDVAGHPFPGIPAWDFWLIDCDPINDLALCAGSASSDADSMTNAEGKTTMSGAIAVGRCAEGLALVVQGFVLLDSLTNCTTYKCLPVYVHTPDLDGNLEANLVDLSLFAESWCVVNRYEEAGCLEQCPGSICRGCSNADGTCDPCTDYNGDDKLNLQDLSLFAVHFGPPGHLCL